MPTDGYNYEYGPAEQAYYSQSQPQVTASNPNYYQPSYGGQEQPRADIPPSSGQPYPGQGPPPPPPPPVRHYRRGQDDCNQCCVTKYVLVILGACALVGLVVLVLTLMNVGPSTHPYRRPSGSGYRPPGSRPIGR